MRSPLTGNRLGGVLAMSFAGFATLAMTHASNAATNLLPDSNFDTFVTGTSNGVGDWAGPYNGGVIGATPDARSAPNAFYGTDGSYATPITYQTLAATAGQEYDLTGYSDITSLTGSGGTYIASVQITFFSGANGSGTNLGTVQTSPGNALLAPSPTPAEVGTYTFVDTGTATAPATTESMEVFPIIQAGAGDTITAYIDDLSLSTVSTSVPEPASLGLLAMAGLPLLRRRRRS